MDGDDDTPRPPDPRRTFDRPDSSPPTSLYSCLSCGIFYWSKVATEKEDVVFDCCADSQTRAGGCDDVDDYAEHLETESR